MSKESAAAILKESFLGEIMERIMVFGGTFDPFHIGHLELLENIHKEIKPDRTIVIPAGHSYMKEANGGKITPADDRVGMVREGIKTLSFDCELSLYEVEKEGPTYSIDTVRHFKATAGGAPESEAGDAVESEVAEDGGAPESEAEIWFVCGSDILFTIDKWYEAEALLKSIVLTVIPRGADDMDAILARKRELEETAGARIYISEFRGREISSSMIRDDIMGHADMVPAGTLEYIKAHHLYNLEV